MSMEGFSATQIAHAQATTLDFYLRGKLKDQNRQERPLLKKMESSTKPFTGGKELISGGARMETGAGGVNDGVTGYSHTDQVGFYNPGNGLRYNYVWREHHIGWTISETQLKQQGIEVTDQPNRVGAQKRSAEVLAPVLEEAVYDFMEQYEKTMNALLWGDGTADTSALHGLRSSILDIPTIGTVGGLNAATYTPWRNFAFTAAFAAHGTFDADWGGGAITSTPANGGALLQALTKLDRQLTRRGSRWDCFMAGSAFIDAMEVEIRANGGYSDTGFTSSQDGSIGDMYFKKRKVVYDPTLDDMNMEKRAYLWPSSDIKLMPLAGDWKRKRTPERPYDQFVFHQSLVCTGQMVTSQRNGAAVIDIA